MVSFGNPVTQPSCQTTSFIRFLGTPGSPMVWLILYPQMVPFLAKLLLLTQNWQLLISRDLCRKLKFSWKFEFFVKLTWLFAALFNGCGRLLAKTYKNTQVFPNWLANVAVKIIILSTLRLMLNLLSNQLFDQPLNTKVKNARLVPECMFLNHSGLR